MSDLKLTLACGPYDRTLALQDGSIQSQRQAARSHALVVPKADDGELMRRNHQDELSADARVHVWANGAPRPRKLRADGERNDVVVRRELHLNAAADR